MFVTPSTGEEIVRPSSETMSTVNPLVLGSNPSGPTTHFHVRQRLLCMKPKFGRFWPNFDGQLAKLGHFSPNYDDQESPRVQPGAIGLRTFPSLLNRGQLHSLRKFRRLLLAFAVSVDEVWRDVTYEQRELHQLFHHIHHSIVIR